MTKTAIIPGTYDPLTKGHLDIIVRASSIFDELIIGVADSPKKQGGTLFTLAERVQFVEDALINKTDCGGVNADCQITVKGFSNLLVDFARENNAHAVIKGLRVISDMEYEFQQSAINYKQDPTLVTLALLSAPEHMILSSSVVKEVASLGGDVSEWVTEQVSSALKAKFAK